MNLALPPIRILLVDSQRDNKAFRAHLQNVVWTRSHILCVIDGARYLVCPSHIGRFLLYLGGWSRDGFEALEIMRRTLFQIVIIPQNLAEMDGIETSRIAQQHLGVKSHLVLLTCDDGAKIPSVHLDNRTAFLRSDFSDKDFAQVIRECVVCAQQQLLAMRSISLSKAPFPLPNRLGANGFRAIRPKRG